ncbi:hypothetical protein G7B40_039880 [Aetokthonos hydrillicola Thurmond2011]|jgi:hypothetical protein|uniref:Uncharacterized protein n=1 Tax=Aetokthonos hydrillicola Thurmond2011 TaxID=2712845 RepID=A0AAP5M9Z5_9CYAN|nr:hypothetical protein [Aetokthonos hydrillicola]MBW4590118.1 hypothetical protein [Aetokthonos hydrillicola CCALA 1050]MDR9900651.1 hypothetical protein [Aetokthonos hydrillicola Thurmond2011]
MKNTFRNSTSLPSNVLPFIIQENLPREEEERLILLGQYVKHLLKNNLIDREWAEKDFDQFLTNNNDRALFGLPLIPYHPGKNSKKQRGCGG